jgi:isopenicillin-N N-acyltransferase-like protein
MAHFPYLEFSGEPFEIGFAHGRTLRDLIDLQLRETLEAAQKGGGLSREQALAQADAQRSKIADLAPHWLDELRGLAEGAGISFEEAIALQVRPGTGAMPEGCTSFGISGDVTAGGRPLAGQTRDLVPAYRSRMFMILLRPTRGTPILAHSVPGELGGVGINGHGVAVFANSLWGKSGRNWMAPPLLRRAALESASADEAVRKISAMHGPAIGNFLIADQAGHVRNVEILHEGFSLTSCDQGVFVHTNNCLDGRLKACEVEKSPSPGSEGRRVRLDATLRQHVGQLNVTLVKQLLSDHDSQPETICRHARSERDNETTAALIVEPATRRLHISYGPPCEGQFEAYTIAD